MLFVGTLQATPTSEAIWSVMGRRDSWLAIIQTLLMLSLMLCTCTAGPLLATAMATIDFCVKPVERALPRAIKRARARARGAQRERGRETARPRARARQRESESGRQTRRRAGRDPRRKWRPRARSKASRRPPHGLP